MDINVGTMNYIAADAIYSLPTRDFIETDFAVALKTFFVKMGEADYVNVEQNCNKFALGATFFMDYLHHNTTNKLSDTGIAFGEFYYTRSAANGGGGHAINITIIANKNGTNQFTVLFFEPQTYSLVQLTQEEIESCEFYRF